MSDLLSTIQSELESERKGSKATRSFNLDMAVLDRIKEEAKKQKISSSAFVNTVFKKLFDL